MAKKQSIIKKIVQEINDVSENGKTVSLKEHVASLPPTTSLEELLQIRAFALMGVKQVIVTDKTKFFIKGEKPACVICPLCDLKKCNEDVHRAIFTNLINNFEGLEAQLEVIARDDGFTPRGKIFKALTDIEDVYRAEGRIDAETQEMLDNGLGVKEINHFNEQLRLCTELDERYAKDGVKKISKRKGRKLFKDAYAQILQEKIDKQRDEHEASMKKAEPKIER